MRLEDYVDFAKSTLAGGGQSGANLGGMVAIVINHTHAWRLATELEAAIHSAEILQPGANLVGWDVEANAYGNCCGRIQNVVQARDVEAKISQPLALVADLKLRERRSVSGDGNAPPQGDMKV